MQPDVCQILFFNTLRNAFNESVWQFELIVGIDITFESYMKNTTAPDSTVNKPSNQHDNHYHIVCKNKITVFIVFVIDF